MKTPVSATVFVLAFSAAVQAQQATGPSTRFEASTGPVTVVSVQPPLPNADDYRITIADLDLDGDGELSRKEVPADQALAAEFGLVDRDRNGRITATELANWK